MSVEGKFANQCYSTNKGIVECSKCKKKIAKPEMKTIEGNKFHFYVYSYLGKDEFIYESNGGIAVCYCSKYCAKKHNHRFRSK